jgi:hypothetical protein
MVHVSREDGAEAAMTAIKTATGAMHHAVHAAAAAAPLPAALGNPTSLRAAVPSSLPPRPATLSRRKRLQMSR